MTETSEAAKPVHIVDVHKFQKNERWVGYKFTVTKQDPETKDVSIMHLQTSGNTWKEAEDHLHQQLIYHYGVKGYSINVVY